ncbi:hypothetical protein PENTCL1PPCAC_20770 [Pristionchus entomophagus]|uniref:ZP domain-containing protein n=1 Tax=Pristionchus entomophagus TaxID=358040 RepID=A0AAV5TWG8_9BILA|nr:hypothetical protein PENTCL1PPCAC_20770 [Pristionchus entomophagus]
MRSALLFLATAAAIHAEIISYADNAIVGTPKVVCEENDLALDIVTSRPFRGNIFVKGRAKDKSCRQSYANNGTNSYSLPLGKCGMQRLRSANPRGVNFVVTVIVSFHPAGFITKNDRAFHVRCFYMEPDEIVTSSIDVSGIPTTELADEMRMPSCEYSVRKDSLNGPALTFANVGETVYHVWECSGAEMGMLVKKCFVTDGDGEDHAVIDFDGYHVTVTLSRLQYPSPQMHDRPLPAVSTHVRQQSDEGARDLASLQVRRLQPALLHLPDPPVPEADGIVCGYYATQVRRN